jgi:hypothetical protein
MWLCTQLGFFGIANLGRAEDGRHISFNHVGLDLRVPNFTC